MNRKTAHIFMWILILIGIFVAAFIPIRFFIVVGICIFGILLALPKMRQQKNKN